MIKIIVPCKNNFKSIILYINCLFCFLCSSCATVEPYQKAFLNDKEMQLTRNKTEYFQTSFQEYREGSSGGSSGVSSAGCGCN